MAVYHFTYHAYCSWMPDRRQGYVRRGDGILPPDEDMAENYRRAARAGEIRFDRRMQAVIVDAVRSACISKGWRLHQARAIPSHVHILVSWTKFLEWKRVSDTLKRHIGIALSKALSRKGPWLSRGESRKHSGARSRSRGCISAGWPLPAHHDS